MSTAPCPCPHCNAHAPEGEYICALCRDFCTPLHRYLGDATADLTRWTVHRIAKTIEDEGGDPATFIYAMREGHYDQACRLYLEGHLLDREEDRLGARDGA